MSLPVTDIQNVVVPIKGTGTKFALRALSYDIPATTVNFYWQVLKSTEEMVLDGNLTCTGTDLAGWNSNTYIIDWALAQLGFTKL